MPQEDGIRSEPFWPRALLFDAAGTLIHLKAPPAETYALTAREWGWEGTAADIAESFAASMREAPPLAFPRTAPDQRASLVREWWRCRVEETFTAYPEFAGSSHFNAFFAKLYRLFAAPGAWVRRRGTRQMLVRMRREGLRLAVVSNFDSRLGTILEGLDLAQLFDVILYSSQAGVAKPDPRIFGMALDRLGISPGQALHVGDSLYHDVAGAESAGIQAILLDSRTGGEHCGCPRIARLSELPGAVNWLRRRGNHVQGNHSSRS